MLLATLIYLASQTRTVPEVLSGFTRYMHDHPVFSVKVEIESNGRSGNGVFVRQRSATNRPMTDWQWQCAGQSDAFIDNGTLAIDVNYSSLLYDRHFSVYGHYPFDRVFRPAGLPYPLLTGTVPFQKLVQQTKLTAKGAESELTATVETDHGPVSYTGDFAADGHVTRYRVDSRMLKETLTFTDYRLGDAAVKSSFDVEAPVGFSPYAFEEVPRVLHLGEKLPLDGVAKSGDGFVVIIDDLVPEGLSAALEAINKTIPVTVVSSMAHPPKLGKFPVVHATEAQLDRAGVALTPQFYLLKSGVVQQGWQGFQQSSADTFVQEVLTFQPGP